MLSNQKKIIENKQKMTLDKSMIKPDSQKMKSIGFQIDQDATKMESNHQKMTPPRLETAPPLDSAP